MFRINREKNVVESLEQSTFSELGFRERENLQEGEPGLGRIFLLILLILFIH
ncbi:MAG: hypothetical protein RI575_11110 [Balneolaceae bacterium]|nr:hypothetical protein [Balneolaceae bacterium]MDR9410609.1 hypothetical protein [Balneolaceae bacterium]